MSIKYVLQPNKLVEEPDIFSASVRISSSVGLEEITDRIVDQGTTVRRADVLAVLENAIEACDNLLLEGMRVQLGGLVDLFPKIKGSFAGPTDSYDPARHQVDVAAMPGARVRKSFRSKAAVAKEEAVKPVPGLVALSQTPAPAAANGDGENAAVQITPGAIGTLDGYRLHYNAAAIDEGIYFVKTTDGENAKVTAVQKNTQKQLVFLVPELAAASTWRLEVRTRYTPEGELRIGQLDGTFITA